MANTIGISTAVGNTYTDPGTYYNKVWLEQLMPQLVLENCGQKMPLPKNSGTLMKFHRVNKITAPSALPTLASYLLTENTNPTETTLGTTAVSVEPLSYGQWVKVSRELKLKSVNPVMKEFTKTLADEAAVVYEEIIRAQLTANSTNQFAGGAANEAAVADASTLTASEVRKGVYTLRKAGVPGFERGMYKLAASPAGVFDIFADSAAGSYVDLKKYTDPSNLERGEVGQLYGTRVIQGTQLGTGTGATDETFHAYLFGKDAFGISELSGDGMGVIMKEPGSQDTSNPLDRFSTVGWHFTMAAKVLQAARVVKIMHGTAAE